MYDCENAIRQRINRMINESESCINLLYVTTCIYTKNMLLYQLGIKMEEIEFLNNMVCCKVNQIKNSPIELQQQDQRDFTLQELVKYDGKDGNPAYIAVNGVVYNVSNNAAWAAASHFGLAAGKDLTSEFASCHAGQSVLNKLMIVGKLI